MSDESTTTGEDSGRDRWRLDAREVISGYDSMAPPRTSLADLPSAGDVRQYTVWLEHRATGIRVEGMVPHGSYTTRDLQLLEIELRKSLFAELELKVARHLRIPGI